MFPKQSMCLKTDLFAWAKSLMLLKSWTISTMKPHSEQETWFFRIVAGFILREGIKLIEYKERAKNILPRHSFQCGTAEAHSQSADHSKLCSDTEPWASCNFTARLYLPTVLFPWPLRRGKRNRQKEGFSQNMRNNSPK